MKTLLQLQIWNCKKARKNGIPCLSNCGDVFGWVIKGTDDRTGDGHFSEMMWVTNGLRALVIPTGQAKTLERRRPLCTMKTVLKDMREINVAGSAAMMEPRSFQA